MWLYGVYRRVWLFFWCVRCAAFLCVLVPLLDIGGGCHGRDAYVLLGACLVGVVALSSELLGEMR